MAQHPPTRHSADPAWTGVLAWSRAFAAAVRDRDFGAGMTLFDPDAIGFGTRAIRADGLETLVREQWRAIWPNTEGFEFDEPTAAGGVSGDGAWFAGRWSSRTTGTTPVITRAGRSTIVLRRDRDRWLAVHTHFSLDPMDPMLGRPSGETP